MSVLLISSFKSLGGCGGLERTVFIWEGVMVLKELILNSLYFGRVGGLGSEFELVLLELRSDFNSFYFWEGVVVLKELILNRFVLWECVMVLKELILNNFYFGEGVVVLKELILNSLYFGRV